MPHDEYNDDDGVEVRPYGVIEFAVERERLRKVVAEQLFYLFAIKPELVGDVKDLKQ